MPKYSKVYLERAKVFMQGHPEYRGYRNVDDPCPVCHKNMLISYVHRDHTEVRDGKQSGRSVPRPYGEIDGGDPGRSGKRIEES